MRANDEQELAAPDRDLAALQDRVATLRQRAAVEAPEAEGTVRVVTLDFEFLRGMFLRSLARQGLVR